MTGGRAFRAAAGAAALALSVAACGGSGASHTAGGGKHAAAHTSGGSRAASGTTSAGGSATTSTSPAPKPRPRPTHPRLLPAATATGDTGFVPAVSWRGQTAAWVARHGDLALLSFNQRLVELHLHSGTVDAGTGGWRWGAQLAPSELRSAVAAFNGGFKFVTGAGGFSSYGRIGSPLQPGLGSIVTYSDGTTDVGSWDGELPAHGKKVVSVRQNLHLLVDHGAAAPGLDCVSCWGAALGGVADPARSALGITADGRLIWAGGEHLTVSDLATALLGAGVIRAVELDINPEWVAGYLYGHGKPHAPPAPVPVVPGQPGVPGQFLAPYERDFFTLVAR